MATDGDQRIIDYRHPEAKRRNNPPARLSAQGRMAEKLPLRYAYNPHLPPVLRFDATSLACSYSDLHEASRQCALEGAMEPGRLRPDFSFIDPAGELILWEHLGILNRDDYRQSWEWKTHWYEQNGFVLGQKLFTTEDGVKSGLDSDPIRQVAEAIEKALTGS